MRSRRFLVNAAAAVVVVLALLVAGRLSGAAPGQDTPQDGPGGDRTAPAPAGGASATPRLPVIATIAFSESITALSADDTAVWVAACTVTRVDPRNDEPVANVVGTGSGAGTTCVEDVAIGAGAVWGSVPGIGLVRIAPEENKVVARVPLPLLLPPIAVTATGVWAVCCETAPRPPLGAGTLIRVDPATNHVAARIRLPGQPVAVAASRSGVWVVGSDPAGAGRVWRVDPASGRLVATIDTATRLGQSVVADGTAVWVDAQPQSGQKGQASRDNPPALLRIDPRSDQVVATYQGATGLGVATVGGVTWTAAPGGLLRLAGTTAAGGGGGGVSAGRGTLYPVALDSDTPLAVSDLAVSQQSLWIATWSGVEGGPGLLRVRLPA